MGLVKLKLVKENGPEAKSGAMPAWSGTLTTSNGKVHETEPTWTKSAAIAATFKLAEALGFGTPQIAMAQ